MELTSLLIPRPKEVWRGDRGGYIFVINIVGPRSAYSDFENANRLKHEQQAVEAANQPATSLQKEYYKFFGIKFTKGTTTGQADEFIQKHRDLMTRSGDTRLDYWNGFLNLWELLCDPDVRREDLDIKKPSLSLARKTFSEWIKEEDFSKDDLDDEAEFVDRLLERKPDLRPED